MTTTSARAIASSPRPPLYDRIVTDADVGKALDWLRDSSMEMGQTKSRLVKAGHMVKHIEALLSMGSKEKSAEARKCDARCDPRWLDAINEEAEAAGEYEKMKSLREAAAARIEAWRTESSNVRSMKI
jgi:hypothetical protein